MEVFPDRELGYFGLSDDHTLLAVIFRVFCLDVAEGARHRQPARDHTMGPQNELLLCLLLTWDLYILYRLRLVDAASILDDSLHFVVFVRPVITRQQEQLLSFVCRHYCATVANISDVALFADGENNDAAAATALVHWRLPVSVLDKAPLCLEAPCSERLRWVLREALLVDDY